MADTSIYNISNLVSDTNQSNSNSSDQQVLEAESSTLPPDHGVGVTEYRGIADMHQLEKPAILRGDLQKEISRSQTPGITVIDPIVGTAIYNDAKWGPIEGKMIERHDGGQFFLANGATLQASPDNIGANSIILSGTIIDETVTIGNNTVVGVGSYLRGNVSVGSSCKIGDGCKINGGTGSDQLLEIQDDVTIGSNSRIGIKHSQRESLFSLSVEHDVEIGENCSITANATNTICAGAQIGRSTALDGVSVSAGISIGQSVTIFGTALPNATVLADIPEGSFISSD